MPPQDAYEWLLCLAYQNTWSGSGQATLVQHAFPIPIHSHKWCEVWEPGLKESRPGTLSFRKADGFGQGQLAVSWYLLGSVGQILRGFSSFQPKNHPKPQNMSKPMPEMD